MGSHKLENWNSRPSYVHVSYRIFPPQKQVYEFITCKRSFTSLQYNATLIASQQIACLYLLINKIAFSLNSIKRNTFDWFLLVQKINITVTNNNLNLAWAQFRPVIMLNHLAYLYSKQQTWRQSKALQTIPGLFDWHANSNGRKYLSTARKPTETSPSSTLLKQIIEIFLQK